MLPGLPIGHNLLFSGAGAHLSGHGLHSCCSSGSLTGVMPPNSGRATPQAPVSFGCGALGGPGLLATGHHPHQHHAFQQPAHHLHHQPHATPRSLPGQLPTPSHGLHYHHQHHPHHAHPAAACTGGLTGAGGLSCTVSHLGNTVGSLGTGSGHATPRQTTFADSGHEESAAADGMSGRVSALEVADLQRALDDAAALARRQEQKIRQQRAALREMERQMEEVDRRSLHVRQRVAETGRELENLGTAIDGQGLRAERLAEDLGASRLSANSHREFKAVEPLTTEAEAKRRAGDVGGGERHLWQAVRELEQRLTFESERRAAGQQELFSSLEQAVQQLRSDQTRLVSDLEEKLRGEQRRVKHWSSECQVRHLELEKRTDGLEAQTDSLTQKMRARSLAHAGSSSLQDARGSTTPHSARGHNLGPQSPATPRDDAGHVSTSLHHAPHHHHHHVHQQHNHHDPQNQHHSRAHSEQQHLHQSHMQSHQQLADQLNNSQRHHPEIHVDLNSQQQQAQLHQVKQQVQHQQHLQQHLQHQQQLQQHVQHQQQLQQHVQQQQSRHTASGCSLQEIFLQPQPSQPQPQMTLQLPKPQQRSPPQRQRELISGAAVGEDQQQFMQRLESLEARFAEVRVQVVEPQSEPLQQSNAPQHPHQQQQRSPSILSSTTTSQLPVVTPPYSTRCLAEPRFMLPTMSPPDRVTARGGFAGMGNLGDTSSLQLSPSEHAPPTPPSPGATSVLAAFNFTGGSTIPAGFETPGR